MTAVAPDSRCSSAFLLCCSTTEGHTCRLDEEFESFRQSILRPTTGRGTLPRYQKRAADGEDGSRKVVILVSAPFGGSVLSLGVNDVVAHFQVSHQSQPARPRGPEAISV